MHVGGNDSNVFQRASASRALLAAMTDLAERLGESLEALENCPLADAYRRAQAVYGVDLPDFWRIWGEWQLPADLSTLGEL